MAPRSQLNSKKRRASVPEDEVAKAQKVQKMASDALPKKRKGMIALSSMALFQSTNLYLQPRMMLLLIARRKRRP